ncbi:TIGR01777 family oxidoreductase [Tundrisphaera lichenicola]|uniref:TIGR01777 family oxidoreductase n=1 Tax=Tundrisphaera lichenicola TaxID=2029860 RepID=UPI003EB72BF7
MRVFITGGSGMIGRRLARRLIERGDQPVVLSRDSNQTRRKASMRGIAVIEGDPTKEGSWQEEIDGFDAVVNLAGQSIFGGRWDDEFKRQIRESRVLATDQLIKAISEARKRPGVFVQGSAIGYYGPRDDEILKEGSPPGTDFLAKVCRDVEAAARPVESLGVRLATIRTGVVLGQGEGALGVMVPIFKWLPGGAAPVGNGGHPYHPGKGRQWISWIHLEDIVGLFLLALDDASARGPINGTAPKPVRNCDFSKELARVLHRPFLPVGPPDIVLRAALGEKAQVVTTGQRVLPGRAEELGYSYLYPELPAALDSVFAPEKPEPKPAAAHGASHH